MPEKRSHRQIVIDMEEGVDQVDEEVEVDEEGDEQDSEQPEERSHCQRYRCAYFIVFLVLLFLLIAGVAAFCLYLGRFSMIRGYQSVNRTFHAITWDNFLRKITGKEIIYDDWQLPLVITGVLANCWATWFCRCTSNLSVMSGLFKLRWHYTTDNKYAGYN